MTEIADSAPSGDVPVAFQDPGYRAAVVDLLGAIAYGEISAFERLAEDAKLAPTLADKLALGKMATVQFDSVEPLIARIAELGSTFLSDAVMDVNRAIKDVAQAAYRGAPRVFRDKEAVTKIRDILDRASKEIEEIVRESRERSQA